jgi:hypothetical protein
MIAGQVQRLREHVFKQIGEGIERGEAQRTLA